MQIHILLLDSNGNTVDSGHTCLVFKICSHTLQWNLIVE